MAPAIQDSGDRLAAVADPDPAARDEARALGARGYDGIAELMADPDVEAVYVATPNHLHRVGVEAARAGRKGRLAAKSRWPRRSSMRTPWWRPAARPACSTARPFDQRHHPAHRALRTALRNGRVGTVTAVRIVYACWLGPDWTQGRAAENWRVDRAKAGGGALMDLAPHGLDLVGFLLDEPIETVAALLQNKVHAYAVDDGATVIGRTRSGVLATLSRGL